MSLDEFMALVIESLYEDLYDLRKQKEELQKKINKLEMEISKEINENVRLTMKVNELQKELSRTCACRFDNKKEEYVKGLGIQNVPIHPGTASDEEIIKGYFE